MLNLGRVTFYFRCWEELSSNYCFIKFTRNIPSISEIWTYSDDFSASLNWTFSWVDIKKIRRPVIVENVIIISVLLIVQCDFYDWLSQNIRWWRVTNSLSWVDYSCRYLGQVLKHTKCVICVIDAFIFKRMEVSTF